MSNNGNDQWQYGELYLSPNQSTFMHAVVKRDGMTIAEMQHWKQNTVAACWHRDLIAIKRGIVTVTGKGIEAMRVQTHANAQRSRAMYDAPFAQALREVVGAARRLRVVAAVKRVA